MRRKLTAVAALAATAVTLAAVAAAGPVAAKQRVAIQLTGGRSFVLTPLTPGAVKPDTGTATFCCWSRAPIMRDGQAIEINDPQMTLIGKRGTSWPATRSGGSTSRTAGGSSPAPGRSFAARASTPGWPEADGEPASRSPTAHEATFEGFLSPK